MKSLEMAMGAPDFAILKNKINIAKFLKMFEGRINRISDDILVIMDIF